MALRSRILSKLVAVTFAVSMLCSFWVPSCYVKQAFAVSHAQYSMLKGCRGLTTGRWLEGGRPAVLKAVKSRPGVPAHYTVTLETPTGTVSFECEENVYILDQAEDVGHDLPYSCRAGACSCCAGKVLSGEIDQTGQAFLEDDQLDEGYCLTCMTTPLSDVTIMTHCEDEL